MAVSAADGGPRRVRQYRGVLLRAASAAVLGPLVLAAVWFGFPWFDLMAALAAPVLVFELARLTRGQPIVRTAGTLYVLAAVIALLWLRHQPP